MRNGVATPLAFDVSVPSVTTAQQVIAVFVIVVLVTAATIIKWRSNVWGLSDAQQRIREVVNEQRLEQTPARLQYHSSEIARSTVDLRTQVRGLTPGDPASGAGRSVRGALGEVTSALGVAWTNRLGFMPALARRTAWLAISVTVFGAIAVSTGAVVAIVSHDPGDPTLADVIDAVTWLSDVATAVATAFPYTGTLWQVGLTVSILVLEWLYGHWQVVAALLVLATVSITAIDRYLADVTIPDRLTISRRSVLLHGIGAGLLIWATGAGIATAGAKLGYPELGNLVGFAAALLVTLAAGWLIVPWAIGKSKGHAAFVAGSDARLAVAYLLFQRAIAGFALTALVLVGMYAVVGVSDGKFARVLAAYQAAPPETQAGIAAVAAVVVAGVLFTVAEARHDIAAALHGAVAQKAVRAKLARRAIPGAVVFFAYVLLYLLVGSILAAFALAIVAGVIAKQAIAFATAAAYRADTDSLVAKLKHPEPMYIGVLAYELTVDGYHYALYEVNGEQFVATDPDAAADAAIRYATALATNEERPTPDEAWYARFLLESGVADPADWNEKLDEKIREATLTALRPGWLFNRGGPRITREAFDRKLGDFDDDRVWSRLHEPDLWPFITIDDEHVALSRDPLRREDDHEWPTLSD